jgi:antitoxin CptB
MTFSHTRTEGSAEGLDARRRRLLFRAWRRGTREMDLVLGRFAEARLAALSDGEVAELERLMDVPDQDLFAWVCGALPAPANYDTPVLRALAAFHGQGRRPA